MACPSKPRAVFHWLPSIMAGAATLGLLTLVMKVMK